LKKQKEFITFCSWFLFVVTTNTFSWPAWPAKISSTPTRYEARE